MASQLDPNKEIPHADIWIRRSLTTREFRTMFEIPGVGFAILGTAAAGLTVMSRRRDRQVDNQINQSKSQR